MSSKNQIHIQRKLTVFITCGILLLTLLTSGCSFTGGPRARAGHLPTATSGILWANPDNLGTHAYFFGLGENGGILYTCKARHIDIDHTRGAADMTLHISRKMRSALKNQRKGFSFSITGEMSSHTITLTYPDDWQTRTDREAIIDEIIYDTAPYLAYTSFVWHEILTWLGVHFMGFEPEFNSAFPWEDNYSNLLGAELAAIALQDKTRSFDKAMTILIDQRLAELDVQSAKTAYMAADKVRGKWYTGNRIPDMKIRNIDIGLDGTVTPTMIEGVPGCENAEPVILNVQTVENLKLKEYGLTMSHRIKPNVFESGRIYKAAGSKKIYVEKHFPIIMDFIKKQAIEKGYILIE